MASIARAALRRPGMLVKTAAKPRTTAAALLAYHRPAAAALLLNPPARPRAIPLAFGRSPLLLRHLSVSLKPSDGAACTNGRS